MAERDESVGEDDETAIPVAQSRIATEAAPIARGDPMASIRPPLPESPPVLAPTLELSHLDHLEQGSDQPSAHDPTQEPKASKREQLAHATHATGPVISVYEPNASASKAEPRDGPAYQLRRQIGVGGMGEVWEAQQLELGRTVALKRLRDGKQSPANVRLFKSEARLTANLDHPNIVTVHELGRDQSGRVFYTMKMIEGTPWSDVLATGERRTRDGDVVKLELRDHLDILVDVSQAIAFAHSRGVIHRDIKPGNVMIGDYGDIQVVDWGLAVALFPLTDAQTWTLADLPTSALVCGTPAYMSPETAMASRDRIGPATDVYLLGAVLFHLLYGRPPHKGKSVDAVIRKAKANAWVIPEERISARLRPWDALLRPVINRALASDPADRYPNAEKFRDELARAIRNYESAKVATRAQEELVDLADHGSAAYPSLSRMITRLEGAIESWPDNFAARQTLARARIELARLAIRHGDLSLARVALQAFLEMDKLPAPEPANVSRRLTLHPVDGTLVSAPRPTDSLVAAGTSNQWVSSIADLGRQSPSGSGPRGSARASDPTEPGLGPARASGSDSARSQPARISSGLGAVASVEIQQGTDESMLDEAQQFASEALRLGHEVEQRERSITRRRRTLHVARALVVVLSVAVAGVVYLGKEALHRERDRAQAERDKLSEVLLDETANTVEAQLDVLFEPVDAALTTSLRWARAGDLDSDDPRVLNRYYMPLLSGVKAATSTLRADATGHEYMLLRQADGWHTRTTTPATTDTPAGRTRADWSRSGTLEDQWLDDTAYDPLLRPWYTGGVALRGHAGDNQPEPVYWTAPYRFATTGDLGVSVSAPATSPSGREFVLAFDLKLGDISSTTSELPRGIDQGQVFVLDEQLQVLALPRETASLTPERRSQLLLAKMAELDDAPISSAAVKTWQQLGDDGPFKLELGDGVEDNFWVGFRKVDKPHRPRVWIGVVVPESHFLE